MELAEEIFPSTESLDTTPEFLSHNLQRRNPNKGSLKTLLSGIPGPNNPVSKLNLHQSLAPLAHSLVDPLVPEWTQSSTSQAWYHPLPRNLPKHIFLCDIHSRSSKTQILLTPCLLWSPVTLVTARSVSQTLSDLSTLGTWDGVVNWTGTVPYSLRTQILGSPAVVLFGNVQMPRSFWRKYRH